MQIYVVKSGELLVEIANSFNVSPAKIVTDNGLENQDVLVVGQALIIQFPEIVHTVKQGETLTSIAREYSTDVLTLLQNNPYLMTSPVLFEGEQLTIRYKGEKRGITSVNGYAYTNIEQNVLLRAIPFLTKLTIFGYGFTETGELIGVDDQAMINLAYEYKVAPIMLLSAITEEGNFDIRRAGRMFHDVNLQNTVIDNILATMKEKGYLGLDIDFEYVIAEDAEAFISFIENATKRLNAEGFTVNVDLAPKLSSEHPGLLYEAHNYERIGAIADTVLLMTYEWGYSHGPPMAVAPINQVKRVVAYAVTVIPIEKIYMGIPNYGYVWRLPYEQGITAGTSIGNQFAVELAAAHNARIEFDEVAKSPFFSYTGFDGSRNEVWFEDVRSIQEKWDVVSQNNLLGGGYWNIMRPFAQNWALINALYNILKIVA